MPPEGSRDIRYTPCKLCFLCPDTTGNLLFAYIHPTHRIHISVSHWKCVYCPAVFEHPLLYPAVINQKINIFVALYPPICPEIPENKTFFCWIHIQKPSFIKQLGRHYPSCLDRHTTSAKGACSLFVVPETDVFPLDCPDLPAVRTFTYSLAFLLLFVDQVSAEAHPGFPYPVFKLFRRCLDWIHHCVDLVSLFFVPCRQLSVEDPLLESMYPCPWPILIFPIYVLLEKIFDNF